jgi:hypothetical protein
MKKITLLLAFVLTIAVSAQTTLTHSLNPFTVSDGGVACWDNVTGEYRTNKMYRAYVLADFGVTGDFEITEVQFGQGASDEGKILGLAIYTADTDDLTIATLTYVNDITHVASSANDLTVVSEPFSATIPAGSIVVFEVTAGDSGANTGESFFAGLNSDGETDDSYLWAEDC